MSALRTDKDASDVASAAFPASLRIVQAVLAVSVVVRVDWWLLFFSGPRTFGVSTFLNTLVLLMDMVAFWLIWKRKRATCAFMIASSVFDAVALAALDALAGSANLLHAPLVIMDVLLVVYFLRSDRARAVLCEPLSSGPREAELKEEAALFAPRKWAFWRNMGIYFCVFSVVGHWVEIPYCMIMNHFGIVDEQSLVWDDPLYPFMVYGFGIMVCMLIAFPVRTKLIENNKREGVAAVQFYVLAVVVCLVMELGMGLLLNQPVDGEYPLWDNSQLPLNILEQAWLVNDLLLGGMMLVFTWWFFPACEKLFAKIPERVMNGAFVVTVVLFAILCVVKF